MISLSQLVESCELIVNGDLQREISMLTADSRKAATGTLFAAWPGERADGHDYISSAVEQGASAVLCERPVDCGSATRLLAEDARFALSQLARVFYDDPADELLLFGVTGTNGKTTFIHIIEEILKSASYSPGVIGTLGTRFGDSVRTTGLTTPGSVEVLASLREMRSLGADAVAMEVSSHALHQHRVSGVSFDVAVFTNLTHDHLDYHNTFEDYFEAKARLVRDLVKADGKVVLNLDDERVATLADDSAITYSLNSNSNADIRPLSIELATCGTQMEVITPRGLLNIKSDLLGRFNASNILAAIAAAFAADIDSGAIIKGVAAASHVRGRLERYGKKGQPVVFVDYAHTPDALSSVLDALREISGGRLFCVFGCGGERDKEKRAPMGKVAAEKSDWVLLTNDNPRGEDPQAILDEIETGLREAGARRGFDVRSHDYEVEPDRAQAIQKVLQLANEMDMVLVAGKGHEDYQLVGAERLHFSDAEAVEAGLATLGLNIKRRQ